MRGAPLRITGHKNQIHFGEDDGGQVDYAAAVSKLIPGEVVAGYLACKSVLVAGGEAGASLGWWIFVTATCLAAVVLLRAWATSDGKAAVPPEWPAVCLATISFLIWVYSFGDVFVLLGWWSQIGSGLFLILWTLLAPAVLRGWNAMTKNT